MEKSEHALTICPPKSGRDETTPLGDMPFSGLGFNLGPVLATTIRLRIVAGAERTVAPPPRDAMRPAGRWLQLRLGREIRGR
jgi:hypothetical protein